MNAGLRGPEPEPLDFFSVDALLSDEERLVAETVRRFVDRDVLPLIGPCFVEHRFPAELVPTMAAMGLLGSTLQGFGCSGLNQVAYGLICRELERGDSSLRSFVSVQTSLVMACIDTFGSDEQRERWLPRMGRGESIGCFGLTESQGGSDPASMHTRARMAGGDWVLDGAKHWITNGDIADVAIVWAVADEGVIGLLVERGMPGFTQREVQHKFSLRASSTGELYFDGVRVPAGNRLPEATSLRAPLSCLDRARFGIAWGAVGAAQACLEEAIAYASERRLFGRALTETQLMQSRLADSVRALVGAQLIALRLAQLKDADAATTAQISLAKWNNVRVALDIARDCRDILGAAGITAEHCAIRHMLNLESVVTYEGTEAIHRLIVGREITGKASF